MAMVVTLLSACSKDEDSKAADLKVTYATAQEIVGTWKFQDPLFSDVVVKGSDDKAVEELKNSFQLRLATGIPFYDFKITFNTDKTCDVIESIDEVVHVRKGTYRVENGRLYFKYKDLVNGDESPLNTGLLEKRDGAIYLVLDKQSLMDEINDRIVSPTDVSDSEREEYKVQIKVITEKIKEIYVPFKIVKI